MAVHTFCLYLSSNLSQNGNDNEGFLGFLEADIKKEARRVASLHCCYCRKPYANVGCCNMKCRHTFHLICGLENGAENQFCGSYQSFCHQHLQKSNQSLPSEETMCLICYDNVINPGKSYNCIAVIEAPCCHNGWFHKLCLQRFAKTSGYFFKCPLCNDSKVFRQKLPKQGIYIPNRDAAWELEPNAFAELLERPNECSAPKCQCKQGRTHSTSSNPFVFCSTCGSTAMHQRCLPNRARNFHCMDCTVNMEHDSGRGSLHTLGHSPDDDNEEIDVCNVEGNQDLQILEGILAPITESSDDSNSSEEEDEVIKIPKKRRSKLKCGSESSRSEKSLQQNTSSQPSCSRGIQKSQKKNLRKRTTSSASASSSSSSAASSESSSSSKSSSSSSLLDESPLISLSQRRNRTASQEVDILDLNRNNPSTHSSSEEEAEENDNGTRPHSRKISTIEINSDNEMNSRCRTPDSLTSDEIRPCRSSLQRSAILISDDEVEIISATKGNMNKADESEEFIDAHDDSFEFETGSVSSADSDDDSDDDSDADSDDDSDADSDDDSDDDPVENFSKMLEKEKKKSFIALRTRNRNENHNQKNQKSLSQNSSIKSVHFKEPKNSKRNSTNNLNISCIAKRTRRQSLCHEKSDEKQQNSSKFTAIQQRRQTVCSETQTEKNKHKERRKHKRQNNEKLSSQDGANEIPEYQQPSSCLYDISQIYEKQQYSDDDSNQRSNNLEKSCIAKRTRKRKIGNSGNIFEIEESSCSSTSSTSSYKTAITDLKVNRVRARSFPKTSENRENIFKPSMGRKTVCTEKWPQMNYDKAFVGKNTHLGNYHPNNVYHPHRSNRKRV